MRFRLTSSWVLLGCVLIAASAAWAESREITSHRLMPPYEAENPISQAVVLTEKQQAEASGSLEKARSNPKAVNPLDHRAFYMVDDFEDGNINGWVADGTQSCSISLSTEVPFGLYSMSLDGACFPFNGYSLDVGNATPTGVLLYVRSDTTNTNDTFFVLGEEFHEVVSFSGGPGEWRVYDGTVHSCGPRNPNQWYYVYFVIDWKCKMYDVYIDGQLKLTNVNFYDNTVSGISAIHVFNLDNTTARYDEIYFETPETSLVIFADDFERGSLCHWSSVVN